MFRNIVSISCLLVLGSAAVAEPVRLASDDLREAVSGSLLELDTPLGTKLAIRFTDNNLMSGEAGKLAPYLGSETDRGRWWISEDQLCYKWFKWFDAETSCISVRRDGSRIYWTRDDGKTGTATLIEQVRVAEQPAPNPAAVVTVLNKDAASTPSSPSANPMALGAGYQVASSEQSTQVEPPQKKVLQAAAVPAPIANATQAEAAKKQPPPKKKSENAAKRAPQAEVKVPKAKAAPAPAVPAVASEPPTFRVERVVEGDVLNVRNGPSTDHDVIGEILPSGRGIKIVGRCMGEWCPIQIRHLSGWVHSYYLSEELPSLASARSSQNPTR